MCSSDLLYGLFRKWYACISVQYSLLLGFHYELIWCLTLYLHSFTGIDFVHFNVLAFLSYNNIVVLIKQVESYVYTHFWAPTHEWGAISPSAITSGPENLVKLLSNQALNKSWKWYYFCYYSRLAVEMSKLFEIMQFCVVKKILSGTRVS